MGKGNALRNSLRASTERIRGSAMQQSFRRCPESALEKLRVRVFCCAELKEGTWKVNALNNSFKSPVTELTNWSTDKTNFCNKPVFGALTDLATINSMSKGMMEWKIGTL